MNQTTYNYIKQLIVDSGLIHSKEKAKKTFHHFNFDNETILITGAAGSIGSELARHLLVCDYKKLILIDIAESPLYNLIKEFENQDLSKITCLLLDITEADSIENLFKTHKPTIIFHAAAYKHVPLMESHPYKAVKTNILATKFLADMALKYEAKKFIFISTDKAVNPINIMGISKHIAENYIIELAQKSKTQFSITRFGNIIGSNGSVLPIFIKQIDSNLPLTITSENISRYFIDKHKACYLILKIATFNPLDEIVFTFNMGNPIKMIDLANCLIDIYADKHTKIDIKTTRLRPGEKYEEDIISKDEFLVPTIEQNILMVKRKNKKAFKNLDLNKLADISPCLSPEEIKRTLLSYI